MADCSFVHSDEAMAFESVTADNSILMRKGEAMTIQVRGLTLRPGRHTLDVGVVVKYLGALRFTVGDAAR